MGFSRQEYRSGLPCPRPGNLQNPVIEPVSLTSLALAGGFFTTGKPPKTEQKCLKETWTSCCPPHSPEVILANGASLLLNTDRKVFNF